MRWGVTWALLAALAVPRSAEAAPSARLVYVRSSDAATCPDETALRKAVSARFGYDPFFAWAKQTVVVQILRDGEKYKARVQLVGEGGVASGTREIVSAEPSCSELFDAAALAISIALDASMPQTENNTAAVKELSVEPEQPPPAPVAPAGPEVVLPWPPPATTEYVTPSFLNTPGPVAIGVEALASAGIGPSIEPGGALFGEYRRPRFSMGLDLSLSMGIPETVALTKSYPGARGSFASSLVGVTITPCARFGPAFACALIEGGYLSAWGWDVSQTNSQSAGFFAAGGRIGVELPLSAWTFVRLRCDLVANLTPATFELDNQSVWTGPVASATLGAGIGTQLP